MERPRVQFGSPEEEIAFLRRQIAEKERELLTRNPEMDRADIETIGRQHLKEYVTFTPEAVLKKNYQPQQEMLAASEAAVELSGDKATEILNLAQVEGVYHALSVLERQADAFLTDEVHRKLIDMLRQGAVVSELKEGVQPWQVLHMTLYEVTMPNVAEHSVSAYSLTELFGVMQQFLAGMRSVGNVKDAQYVLELSVADNSDDIVLYVAVPNQSTDLFEKQLLSLFPEAILSKQTNDYNIFVPGGTAVAAVANLRRYPIYPIRTAQEFTADPLLVLVNAFSKIEREGGGASVQILIHPKEHAHIPTYERIIERIEGGMKPSDSIAKSTLGGEMMLTMKEMFKNAGKQRGANEVAPPENHSEVLNLFREKITSPVVDTNIRLVVSAGTEVRAQQILSELEATFNQFNTIAGNSFTFQHPKGKPLRQALRAYSFREFDKTTAVALSEAELATIFHFPETAFGASPQLKQSYAKSAAAPTNLPNVGTLLGKNLHRGVERDVFITDEDRLRHFYIIGQTGTGKTTLMKNMIMQDIYRGDGVCFIDPHGTDIEDILGAIPEDRAEDVIYFDPSNTESVLGLNMLEFDPTRPEQKTFVVNELFSIFQKLYGANPESMGPMFEQYFRNATLLVLEDPESGNTLMDISRVMSEAAYRRQKLEKATNPVVVQFWREIATKAGGEASLENIVPYIVSKFDVFTANDFIRPIIGQQESSLRFREIMDTKKILLVNLAKGRIGDINANLLGMIIVGKLLMAALSRVDDKSRSFPPFYLHMDEFQNISTDSIAAIFSEARKYKLGLTVAHQFIAQLESRIKDAVFGNVGSLVAFRVGPDDATFLEQQFNPPFAANDLMNIPNRHAYARVLANGTPTQPFSLATVPPPQTSPERTEILKAQSGYRYGRARIDVEREIQQRYQKSVAPTISSAFPPAVGKS